MTEPTHDDLDAQVNAGGSMLRMGFGGSKDQAGGWWVMVTVQAGPTSYTFGIPLDQADTFADGFAQQVKDTAREVRRERSGLVIASSNGNHGPAPRRRRR